MVLPRKQSDRSDQGLHVDKNKMRLTNQIVERLATTGKDYKVWDEGYPGLYVRVSPAGAKSYGYWYRNADRRGRSIVLGKTSNTKIDQARKAAVDIHKQVNDGDDPSAIRQGHLKAPNIAQLWETYLEQHARPKKKPRSVEEDERLWRLHLKSRFARMKVASIGVADVRKMHADMRGTPGAANRATALLSKMMSFAVENDWRNDNPCKRVERYPEHAVERFLTPAEAKRILTALDEESDQCAATIIRFLLLTGSRKSQAMSLRWDALSDLEGSQPTWTIRAGTQKSERGARKDLRMQLSREAASLLVRWRRACPTPSLVWVFPSERDPKISRQCIKDFWMQFRAKMGVPDLRIHDLRHSFASFAVNAGVPIASIQKALCHKDIRTTLRYAHLSDETVRSVGDTVSEAIGAK